MSKISISDLLARSLDKQIEENSEERRVEEDEKPNLNLDLETIMENDIETSEIPEDLVNNMIGAVGAGVAVNAVLDARYEARCSCQDEDEEE